MKKGMKTAGVVALSAVFACGALGALAGCNSGGGNPRGDKDTLTVSIFCNTADATTNKNICDQWAKEYGGKIGKNVRVELSTNTDKTNYYTQLDNEWSTSSTADIIYLSPRYVKSYAENGNILDLSQYLNEDQFQKTQDVWQNGISYYGYVKGQKNTYKMGQPIKAIQGTDGKYGFVTDDGTDTPVELYGLPKDYSNFSTGYNRVFFSDKLKQAYQTTKPNSNQRVKSPVGEGAGEKTSKLENGTGDGYYTHDSINDQCIFDAATGEVTNIINIGKPTTYYPYNFFRWKDYMSALNGGDPVALLSSAVGGYTVTLPGFPDEIFEDIGQEDFNAIYGQGVVDFDSINVPYDKTIAHTTYTYAEYGALLWAVTYYLNTFAWDTQIDNEARGGRCLTEGNKTTYYTIYGGEQYEGINGATGSVLYLLPWLSSNDADLINGLSTLTANPSIAANTAITDPAKWKEVASTATYEATRQTLADEIKTKNIQYGHNSQNFIETYAAFLAIGSDWNANPSGDTDATDRGTDGNGWGYFRRGRSICYGAGSWDPAARNDVNSSILEFGQMPTPIAEKYALYSEVKDANYQKQVYANDPAPAAPGSTDEGKQLTDAALATAKSHTFTAEEIRYNQLRRQDKWAARMDTVGYTVVGKVAEYTGDHEWKLDAAIDLTVRLTIDYDAQTTLLYGGAQFPNFVSQCKDFVYYQDEGYENGYFKDMLTPNGFANGEEAWDQYYRLALDMEQKAQAGVTTTVEEYLASQTIVANPKYDASYAKTRLSDFTGEGNARLAYAMKVLRMVAFRAEDRDINIRMQYGLNSIRDSSMYTYKDDWMGSIDARTSERMMAYRVKTPFTNPDMIAGLLVPGENGYTSSYIQMNPASTGTWTYMTPAVWCLSRAPIAQELLIKSLNDEQSAMRK